MIEHSAFTVEEWSLREVGIHLDALAQAESLFALSNGHIGLRGNLDEGEPHGLPGTYLNSVYELRPLPSVEGGYAYPETIQNWVLVEQSFIIHDLITCIEARGCRLLFLPAYSPDFSPIEQAFSKLKASLRRVGARTREDLQEAIAQALTLITAQDALGWFTHCGYPPPPPSEKDQSL